MTKVRAIIRNTSGFCDDVSDLTLQVYDRLLVTEAFYIDETTEIEDILEFTYKKFDYFTCNMYRGTIQYF